MPEPISPPDQGASEAMMARLLEAAAEQSARLHQLEQALMQKRLTSAEMVAMSPHFQRNFLSNDDSAVQKNLVATWRLDPATVLGAAELAGSGFRVFSQNDEDGVLLRLFTHVGHTNRQVVEIGSNCAGSEVGIPENLSANLIVNHGWHGMVLEMDGTECETMRYFFAREHATRHYHWMRDGENTYFSPHILQRMVTPQNINALLAETGSDSEPDLMVIDIDGGDYPVIQAMHAIRPRVLVVEFEKRFRDRHCVVQFDRDAFSKRWQQSGAASLPAWEKLLERRGYVMCAIGACGFNAFFVRADVAHGKLKPLTMTDAFDAHPIFSRIPEPFWLEPDESWHPV
jgi:hypothetical protein